MVMLDVLIIGGGPHALTLATMLSTPNADHIPANGSVLPAAHLDPPTVGCQSLREIPKTTFRGKKGRRGAARQTFEEHAASTPVLCPPFSHQDVVLCPPLSL